MFASHIAPTLTTNIDLLTQKTYLVVANYHLQGPFIFETPIVYSDQILGSVSMLCIIPITASKGLSHNFFFANAPY